MPDSTITKKALSHALMELMKTESFQKISISDICDGCSMNRKSFYYHFKDKYDLVNWIFDNEFIAIVQRERDKDTWTFLLEILRCFYDNRVFYRKALSYQGQNSLSEHLVDEMGLEAQTRLYMNLPAGRYAAYPEGLKDNTHLQPMGAMVFGGLIARGLMMLGEPYAGLLSEETRQWLKDGGGMPCRD